VSVHMVGPLGGKVESSDLILDVVEIGLRSVVVDNFLKFVPFEPVVLPDVHEEFHFFVEENGG
jgi:hypothetical protein